MKGTLRTFGFVFGGIGLAMMLVAAALAWNTLGFIRGAVRTEAVIIALEGDGTKAPLFEFTTPQGDRVRVRSSVSSDPPGFHVGERVHAYHDAADPTDATIDSFGQLWLAPAIVGGMGLPFFAVGFFTLYLPWRRARMAQELRQHGRQLLAKLDRVELDETFAVNNVHPWRVHVRWLDPETGEMHQFRSEHLWEDPTGAVPDEVTVFVDPRRMSRYHVDLWFLAIVEEAT